MADEFHFGQLTGETGDMGEAIFKRPPNIALFYRRSVHMPYLSKQAGIPVHEGRDFVKLITPGEKDEVDREVTELDKRMYASAWAQFQNNQEQIPDGTPLAHLFPGSPEIVDNLRSLKFHTVEQLAEAPDAALTSIAMGAYDFQNKAKRFLEGKGVAGKFQALEMKVDETARENERLRKTIEDMQLDAELRDREAQRAEAAPAETVPRAGRR